MSSRFLHKQSRRFARWRKRNKRTMLHASVLLLIGLAVYAGYMSDRQLHVNPASYQALLQLIGRAESNGNYNAYFGNAGNSQIQFTSMTIAEVLDWQHRYVQQGSASSAVGRYQIINTTLQGLVGELRLNTSELFSPALQDKLAIALLERRGSKRYVGGELSAEQFAANLAQEWAALPRTIGGNPHASYYAGDGLNASRVRVPEVLGAIQHISRL